MKRASMLRLAGLKNRFFALLDENTSSVGAPPFQRSASQSEGRPSLEVADAKSRISQPLIRKSYYLNGFTGDTTLRGREPFVAVGWDEAIDLVAQALTEAMVMKGVSGIYACSDNSLDGTSRQGRGSYLHRFLDCLGGCTDGIGNYRYAPANVLLPHVLGAAAASFQADEIFSAEGAIHCKRIVCMGGASAQANGLENVQGSSSWRRKQAIEDGHISVVNVSPVKDGAYAASRGCWLACRPDTEVAIMLALVHTLIDEDLYDKQFISTHCSGFGVFASYVMGESDGVPKNASWAEAKSEIEAQDILTLARLMAAERCVLELSASNLASESGEHFYWAGIALAAALGYIGLPGGGLVMETEPLPNGISAPPEISNPLTVGIDPFTNTARAIPIAQMGEMLESPGLQFPYNGQDLTYPDIALVYCAGADPLHFHPDSNRLHRALHNLQCSVVHASNWNETARYADIVLPDLPVQQQSGQAATLTDETGGVSRDSCRSGVDTAESWTEIDIFCALADRLDRYAAFRAILPLGEGAKNHIHASTSLKLGGELTYREGLEYETGRVFCNGSFLSNEIDRSLGKFRADPLRNPLSTPSGKIELFSNVILDFEYENCAGHPTWYEKEEWLGSQLAVTYPFHLLARTMPVSSFRTSGDGANYQYRPPTFGIVWINPMDAQLRGIANGSLMKIFNQRGAFIARAQVSTNVRRSVLSVENSQSLGVIYSDLMQAGEFSVNLNSVTKSGRASALSMGAISNGCLVNVERIICPIPVESLYFTPTVLYNISPTAFQSASRR
ncbi:molybdopterin-dependent oxidoreductase [Pseudomonas sp. NPDC088368]|uniref:molybdopterin-dependent oxidoreductase n=1 Tax=Pseudomonas sp. NPDC088368 TaxID=3364453 RepID=UPI0038225E0D